MTVSWTLVIILGFVLLVLLISALAAHDKIDTFQADIRSLKARGENNRDAIRTHQQAIIALEQRLNRHIQARPRKKKAKEAPAKEEPEPVTVYDRIAADDDEDD